MYRILSTNSESLTERGLDLKNASIDIIALESELKEFQKSGKQPKLYAYRWGQYYDEEDNFSPNIKGKQAIKGQLVEEYFLQKDTARKQLEKIKQEIENEKRSNTSNEQIEKLYNQINEQKDIITALNDISEKKSSELFQLTMKLKEAKKSNSGENLNVIDLMKKQQELVEKLSNMTSNRIEIKIGNKSTKIIEKVVHEKFIDILKLISKSQAVYCYGPAGTGKSELAKQLSEALEIPFYPMSTLTQEFKLSGFIDGNGKYHETNFYKAFKNGGLFFLDEMDSCISDVLVGINGALANGYYDFPIGTVEAHENFRVVSAGNTIGRGGNNEYTGRQVLDMSTLDRFWGVEIDYSLDIEKSVSNNDMELVQFAHELRNAAKNTDISILMSYRSMSRLANFQEDFELSKIIDYAITKGMDKEDLKMLARNMNLENGNKYYKAFKAVC